MTRVDVSVVVVNFNSGDYLLGCLASLRGQSTRRRVETIVVDSASTLDQSAYLDEACRGGARVLRCEVNAGYAGGCNRGLQESSGRTVVFANADVVCLPGALRTLADFLETEPAVGFAEPRTFLDAGRAFRVPEMVLATPASFALEALEAFWTPFARRRSRRRALRSLPSWRAEAPRLQPALTAAFLGAKREAIEGLGGFDEGFPLYFEDSDLFRRASAAGWGLALLPAAEVVHYAHRSAVTVWEEAMTKLRAGRARYLERHFGRMARRIDGTLQRLVERWRSLVPAGPLERLVDLGECSAPPVLELTGTSGDFVLELAFEPRFVIGAGHPGSGTSFAFSPETWASLPPGRYFLRALDVAAAAPRGAWTLRRR